MTTPKAQRLPMRLFQNNNAFSILLLLLPSPNNTVTLSRWGPGWRTIDRFPSAIRLIRIVRLLELDPVLLTTKISLITLIIAIITLVALIVAIVPLCSALIVRRRVWRCWLCGPGVLRLSSSILSWCVAGRNPTSSPASSTIWSHPRAATSSGCYTTIKVLM